MQNYIRSTVSLFALVAFAPETETASNGVTIAKTPRILEQGEAVSTDVGTANPEKTASLKAKRLAAKHNAAPGIVAKRGVAKQHKSNTIAASDKLRRISRVEPICKVIALMMDRGTQHVAKMAEKAKCSEREVRLAIDKLRAAKWKIINKPDGLPKTFGYVKGFKRPKI